tara:strand:+ start:925 stop:1116 length:192 start_codon:yes stop_codon:yes gene_type:complete
MTILTTLGTANSSKILARQLTLTIPSTMSVKITASAVVAELAEESSRGIVSSAIEQGHYYSFL